MSAPPFFVNHMKICVQSVLLGQADHGAGMGEVLPSLLDPERHMGGIAEDFLKVGNVRCKGFEDASWRKDAPHLVEEVHHHVDGSASSIGIEDPGAHWEVLEKIPSGDAVKVSVWERDRIESE